MSATPPLLSPDDTRYLKGIAILLMLAHHLFGFPERILPPAELIPLSRHWALEVQFGIFAKICVPMFMFLAGYGFSRRANISAGYVFDKLGRLFGTYWFYFALFIPVGMAFFPDVRDASGIGQRFSTDPVTILANLFAISDSYNNEWWFLQTYALLLIALPAIARLGRQPWLLMLLSVAAALAPLVVVPASGLPRFDIGSRQFLIWQFPFVLGFLFERMIGKQATAWRHPLFILPALAATLLLVKFLGLYGGILATPIFAALCLTARTVFPALSQPFMRLGDHSLPMWLIHTFFCYYFFQGLVFLPRYSIAVFIVFVAMTYGSAYGLERLRLGLLSCVRPATRHAA
ncbi:MAG: acyltransferase family protein [Betaproteobacteria bacterium]